MATAETVTVDLLGERRQARVVDEFLEADAGDGPRWMLTVAIGPSRWTVPRDQTEL